MPTRGALALSLQTCGRGPQIGSSRCTSAEARAGAADSSRTRTSDRFFLGLLQTILAIMVHNGAGIELGVQVNEEGDPVVVCTHGSADNVFWSRATVSGQKICTVTLMIAVFASVQNVPFVCVHPIGSHILGRGGTVATSPLVTLFVLRMLTTFFIDLFTHSVRKVALPKGCHVASASEVCRDEFQQV